MDWRKSWKELTVKLKWLKWYKIPITQDLEQVYGSAYN